MKYRVARIFLCALCVLAVPSAFGQKYPQKFRDFFPAGDSRVPAALGTAKCDVRGPDGSHWTCTPPGVTRRLPDGTTEYLAGLRYLPSDRVTGIYVESPSLVWIATEAGVSRIEYRPMTLEQKADFFERRLQERHDREGFIGGVELTRPGDVASFRKHPHDNDGLWTSIYVGAEAFRYAVTKNPEAKARARRSMEAMMRLEPVTGIPGFPARAMIRLGEYRHPDGVWRPSPDGVHEWKSDTSSDELVGHYFAFAVYYDLVAEESEKPALRALVSRITRHLIDHNYALIDWTGKPTTWARYSAEYLKDHPQEQSLNTMLLVSHLLVAHHITGDPSFRQEYDKLIGQGYHLPLTRYIESRLEINYSDEEMAMLGYYPLLKYERNAALRRVYLKGLAEWWENEVREKNPAWIAINDACTGKRDNAADGIWTLAHIPMDLIEWKVVNSHRPGLVWDKDLERSGKPQTTTLLPADERPVMKWNANPFVVDGGDGGRSEDDGAAYLLAYWMGRYFQLWK